MVRLQESHAAALSEANRDDERRRFGARRAEGAARGGEARRQRLQGRSGACRAAEAKHVANAYKGEVRRMSHTASEADLDVVRDGPAAEEAASSAVLGLRRDLEEVKKTARDAVATARELRRARGDDNEASEDESDAEVAFVKRQGAGATLTGGARRAPRPTSPRTARPRRRRAIERLSRRAAAGPAARDPPGAIQFFASGDSPRRPASGDSPRRPATTPRVTVPGPGPPDYLGELCYAIPAGDGGLARDRRRATAFGDGLLQRQPYPLFA
ncbi:hypothetical protein SO694_00031271 [Aureococcus anophagefferens]|uniref:Uncharacterized protein n=1 Tax=Aureococcus anophagefferens TaxID=44056 RepID=A0ABR1FJK9_AURAN